MAPAPSLPSVFVDSPLGSALFVDFDGTLSDITADHVAARPRAGVVTLLESLARRLARVAVISGRPVDQLLDRLGDGLDLVGLYGLEQQIDGRFSVLDEVERWRPVVDTVARRAREAFGAEAVEAKGLSLTLHHRRWPEAAAEMDEWCQSAAAETGLERRLARQSVELHPPVACDKGTALESLARGLGAVAYVGDDVGDLPAFDGLDRLGRAGVDTFRVAVGSDEAPCELLARADVVVDGPEGVQRLLERLDRQLARS